MSNFTQAESMSEIPDNVVKNSGPNAFQDFAANLWGGHRRNSGESGGAILPDAAEQAGCFQPATGHIAEKWLMDLRDSQNSYKSWNVLDSLDSGQVEPHIDEIPGILNKLNNVTEKAEVTVDAKVAEVLPDYHSERSGLTHEQFVVEMPDHTDVFVAHDLTFAPRVPLNVGESVEIKGEWIPTPDDETHGKEETIGVLHWTHHSEDENKHPSGFIEADGHRYQ
jgi:hypothetical protein